MAKARRQKPMAAGRAWPSLTNTRVSASVQTPAISTMRARTSSPWADGWGSVETELTAKLMWGDAGLAQLTKGFGCVALGEFLAVGPQDQPVVAIGRGRQAED